MQTVTETQATLMGQQVTVTKMYWRDLVKGVRQWVEVEQAPATGWIVGFRTIWDGYVDWDTGEYGQKESGNYFVPTGHKECALVVFSPRQKPVNVPLDGFELVAAPDLLAVAETNLKILQGVYDTPIETGLLGILEYGILEQAIAETTAAIAAAKTS